MTEPSDDYRFGYSPGELTRLGDQHRLWSVENRRFLERAGFQQGATLVDLGCGPGYTTIELARTVGPKGRVIAVDRDGERSLPLLRDRASAAGLENIETRTAALEDFDLPAESVDGLYGRWVLMYLPETEAKSLAVRAARWLRPGGACALAEFCNYRHIAVHPPCTRLPEIAEALMRAVAGGRGCNAQIGNALPGLLRAAGLQVEIHVTTKAVRAGTPEWGWPDALFRTHLPGLVKEGYLSSAVLDAFLEEWEKRTRDPGAIFFGSPMMETVARRT